MKSGLWKVSRKGTQPVPSIQPTYCYSSFRPLWPTSISPKRLSLAKFIKWLSLTTFICIERVEDYRNMLQLVGYVEELIQLAFHGLSTDSLCAWY